MPVRKKVLVYGGCLNLAGLTACLKQDSGLEVLIVHPGDQNATQCLETFNPETIIFDMTDPSTNVDLVLLKSRPHTLLIGVDPSSDHVLVLTGKRSRVVTANELAQLVSTQAYKPPTGDKVLGDNEGGEFDISS